MPARLSNKARYVLALVAFAVFVGATIFLAYNNPKEEIRRRLGDAVFIKTDSTPGYDIEKVQAMFRRYTPDDFKAHKLFLTRYDAVYPLCYSIPDAVLLWLLWSSAPLARRRVIRLAATLLPLLAAAFDYAENVTMYWYISDYPDAPLRLLEQSRAMTEVKWLLVALTLLMMLVGCVWWLAARLRGRGARKGAASEGAAA
jgi:hypothetical protein